MNTLNLTRLKCGSCVRVCVCFCLSCVCLHMWVYTKYWSIVYSGQQNACTHTRTTHAPPMSSILLLVHQVGFVASLHIPHRRRAGAHQPSVWRAQHTYSSQMKPIHVYVYNNEPTKQKPSCVRVCVRVCVIIVVQRVGPPYHCHWIVLCVLLSPITGT